MRVNRIVFGTREVFGVDNLIRIVTSPKNREVGKYFPRSSKKVHACHKCVVLGGILYIGGRSLNPSCLIRLEHRKPSNKYKHTHGQYPNLKKHCQAYALSQKP